MMKYNRSLIISTAEKIGLTVIIYVDEIILTRAGCEYVLSVCENRNNKHAEISIHHCRACAENYILLGMCQNSAMASNHGTDDERQWATSGIE
jgi:hypothetical protein